MFSARFGPSKQVLDFFVWERLNPNKNVRFFFVQEGSRWVLPVPTRKGSNGNKCALFKQQNLTVGKNFGGSGGTRFKDPGEKYFAAQANGCWQSQKARKDPIFTRNREPQTSESGKKPKKIEGFSSFLNRSVQKRIFRPSTFRRCPFCSFGFIFGQNSAFISVLVNKKNPFFFGFCNRMALVFCLCVCACFVRKRRFSGDTKSASIFWDLFFVGSFLPSAKDFFRKKMAIFG